MCLGAPRVPVGVPLLRPFEEGGPQVGPADVAPGRQPQGPQVPGCLRWNPLRLGSRSHGMCTLLKAHVAMLEAGAAPGAVKALPLRLRVPPLGERVTAKTPRMAPVPVPFLFEGRVPVRTARF